MLSSVRPPKDSILVGRVHLSEGYRLPQATAKGMKQPGEGGGCGDRQLAVRRRNELLRFNSYNQMSMEQHSGAKKL